LQLWLPQTTRPCMPYAPHAECRRRQGIELSEIGKRLVALLHCQLRNRYEVD